MIGCLTLISSFISSKRYKTMMNINVNKKHMLNPQVSKKS